MYFPAQQLGIFHTESEALRCVHLSPAQFGTATLGSVVAEELESNSATVKILTAYGASLVFAYAKNGNVSVWRSTPDWVCSTHQEAEDLITNFQEVPRPGLWAVFAATKTSAEVRGNEHESNAHSAPELATRPYELDRDERLWDTPGFRSQIKKLAGELNAIGEASAQLIPKIIEKGRWGSGVVAWIAAYERGRKGDKTAFLRALAAKHKVQHESGRGWHRGTVIERSKIAALVCAKDLAQEIDDSLSAAILPLAALETLLYVFPTDPYTKIAAHKLLLAQADGTAQAITPGQSVEYSLKKFPTPVQLL